jgi:hypothetical protein
MMNKHRDCSRWPVPITRLGLDLPGVPTPACNPPVHTQIPELGRQSNQWQHTSHNLQPEQACVREAIMALTLPPPFHVRKPLRDPDSERVLHPPPPSRIRAFACHVPHPGCFASRAVG